jgi:hypothetical protein
MKRTPKKPIAKPRGKIANTRCRLCTQPATLQDSHIIPELCYRPLYDPKHRATLLNLDENRRTFLQKGLREHLLCKKCEGKLSTWEALFKRYWLGNPTFKQPVNGPFITVKGLPWPAFKLFHLSILWRMSITTRKEFDAVDLGTKYNETLRQMLDHSDPGKPEEFPVLCEVMTDDHGKPLFDLISQPHESRLEGKRAYWIVFAGAVWIYVVTQKEEPGLKQLYPAIPNQSGQLIARVVKPSESHYLNTVAAQLRTQKQKPTSQPPSVK